MNANFILTQSSKNGERSFEIRKTVNLGNSPISSVSLEIANFCKDIIELCQKNEKVGYKSAVSNIRKSLKTTLTITSEEETLSLEYRNFGKFAHNSTRENIQSFLKNNIEFTQKWG